MSDKKASVGPRGVTTGDWTFGAAPKNSTDDHLDTVEGREHELRGRQQADLAREAGEVAPEHPITNPLGPRPYVVPAGEDGAMDDAIEEARAAQHPAEQPAVPIILRDPVTGEPIGEV